MDALEGISAVFTAFGAHWRIEQSDVREWLLLSRGRRDRRDHRGNDDIEADKWHGVDGALLSLERRGSDRSPTALSKSSLVVTIAPSSLLPDWRTIRT